MRPPGSQGKSSALIGARSWGVENSIHMLSDSVLVIQRFFICDDKIRPRDQSKKNIAVELFFLFRSFTTVSS
jgi:hypothetical protein